MIKANFYETWGRKNGDQANCPNYSPLCTYVGMQDRLKSPYKIFADNAQVIVARVGEDGERLLRVIQHLIYIKVMRAIHL